MNSTTEFLRVLRHEQSLSTAHRALRLRLGQAEEPGAEILLPQLVEGSESLCGGVNYRVSCVASDATLALKSLIALPAELQIVTDRGVLRSVCGIVAEACSGDADGGLASYQLVLRDALALMEQRVNSRIFRKLSELDIVQLLFDEWRHANAVLAKAFEYELDPLLDPRHYPPREQTMQYNESDAAFVRRLLRRRGIGWQIRPGRSRASSATPDAGASPAHTLVLFANPHQLPENPAGSVRYLRDDGAGQRDTIDAWSAARSLQPGRVTRHSWDYKAPGGGQFMHTEARFDGDQGAQGNAFAASLDDYLIEAPHAGNELDDHCRLGQLRMQRHAFEAKCFHGEGSVRDFCAGQYFTLVGHPEIDSHALPERQFVITELQLSMRNNLPGELSARVDRLLARNHWGQYGAGAGVAASLARPVRVRFSAVRRGVAIVPAFDADHDFPHPPLQSAIVVGPVLEEVHCDALGRVKIRFPGMRAQDHAHAHGVGASSGPADSAWVRVAASWAGNGPGPLQQCGTLSLPRVGSEVLVAFVGGDPDRPVILSQMFNGRAEPPALSPAGGLPGNRYLSGMRSREVGGQRGNGLRFDDTTGQISAQLASDHGSAQVNLGWLTQPRSDGKGAPRGAGAELRTDHQLALRGQQGVLLTAESASAADGSHMARAGLLGLAELMQSVVTELGKLAEQHSDDEASSGRLGELVAQLKGWDGAAMATATATVGTAAAGATAPGTAAPMVAVTAPAGILLASPANVALCSEKKLDLASGGDAELGAARNVFVRAARGISAFAHALGIKLVAARGNVTIEAHQGGVQIKSQGRISLISGEAIYLEAPQVRVVARGAQTDWDQGCITQQSAAEHLIKSASLIRAGPADASPSAVNFAASAVRSDERLVLRNMQTRQPLPHQRYIAHCQDGRAIAGVSDAEGRTTLVQTNALGPVRFEVLDAAAPASEERA